MFIDDFVILDFETTGLSPAMGARITEVGAVRLHAGKIVDRFQSLANCGVPIPSFITDYTGITQQMVDRAPPVRRVIRSLLKFIGETPIVAHKASFDKSFLDSECAILRSPARYQAFICSMQVSRRVYPHFSSHALGALAQRLRIAFPSAAHRAGADAEVTAKVMIRMGHDLRTRYRGLVLDTQLLRGLMGIPIAGAAGILRRRANDSTDEHHPAKRASGGGAQPSLDGRA